MHIAIVHGCGGCVYRAHTRLNVAGVPSFDELMSDSLLTLRSHWSPVAIVRGTTLVRHVTKENGGRWRGKSDVIDSVELSVTMRTSSAKTSRHGNTASVTHCYRYCGCAVAQQSRCTF